MATRGTPPKPPGSPILLPRARLEPKRPAKGVSEPAIGQTPEAEPIDRVDRGAPRDRREKPGENLNPRERIGDETLDAASLGDLSVLLAAEHLMLLLAKGRGKKPRAALLAEVGDLLLGHPRPEQVKKILAAMAELRIVDIYPLEVLAYVLEREPRLLEDCRFDSLIKNKRLLQAFVFEVEAPIRIELPLSAKVRAMALEGGGTPGYHLYPGGLAEYFIELGDEGSWTLLLRAEIHRASVLDRVVLQVRDTPGSP